MSINTKNSMSIFLSSNHKHITVCKVGERKREQRQQHSILDEMSIHYL